MWARGTAQCVGLPVGPRLTGAADAAPLVRTRPRRAPARLGAAARGGDVNTAHVLTASRERARFTSAPPPPTGLGVRGVAVERTTASAGTGARVQPHA
eukprot:CAMPEP_0180035776 /NCGR_PEP_ID=MMETSP0984-20121128/30493_1 /TAXON_ID=483367 /ORGANISM="non described non described, Strain CCMP 2436" /LENGTH=97 /DNA_ID=CAMNT_0021961745 /DNA_START=1 /DNA_END=291 /DNA_ORIENTATION=-